MPAAKKGHWTKGKRRNPDQGTWSKVRLTLQSLVDEYYEPKLRSRAKVARDLEVSDRTVRRWLKGEDIPSVELQMAVRQWCATQVKAIKADMEKAKKNLD
jgi:transcriptional regulator with XRE-family HTH domain